MSIARWLAPTSCCLPSPSITYFVTALPLAGAAVHVTRADALPGVAVTRGGAPGGPTGGFAGGGGGGTGGASPPTTSLLYLSTTCTWCFWSTTRAVDPP